MRSSLALALLDQILLSAFNLLIGLALVRQWTPELFGVYSVVFTLGFAASSLQNAVIATQLSVLRPKEKGTPAERLLLGSFGFVNLALAMTAGLAVLVGTAAVWASSHPGLPWAAGAFIVAGVLREYARSVLFSELDLKAVLLTDFAYVMVTALGLVADQLADGGLGLAPVLLAQAVGSLLAIAPTVLRRRDAFRPRFAAPERSYFRDVWRSQSRWALIGVVASEIQSRGYVLIVGAAFGTAAVGTLQAGAMLFRPLNVLAQAWSRIARTWLADRFNRGARSEAQRFAHWSAAGFVAATVGLVGTVMLVWPLLERELFRGNYPGIATVVLLWGAIQVLLMIGAVYSLQVQALLRFKELSRGNVIGAGVALGALGLVCVQADWRLSILAVAAGQIALLIVIARILAHDLAAEATGRVAAEGTARS